MALPLIILDANTLRNLHECDRLLADAGSSTSLFALLDRLSAEGKATILIPRSVFNESTNWAEQSGAKTQRTVTGYLDFTRAPDGTLGVCLDRTRLNFKNTHSTVDWLTRHRDAGTLRVYDSLANCFLTHDEARAGKGGVVLLDAALLDHRPIAADGIVTKAIKDIVRASGKETGRNLIPNAENGIGKGDAELDDLARALNRHCQNLDIPGNYLLITDDRACRERTQRHTEDSSVAIDLAQFLAGLQKQGLLPRNDFDLLLDKGPDSIALHSIRSLLNHPGTKSASQWLAAIEPAQSPTR